MKKITFCAILLALASLVSSCNLARGIGQTAGRTVQSVSRAVF